ncbi:hypothetical protein MAPG_11774 [Magnaporthiopsis poae ATCC 64411]|uniref:Tyrosinase copper-binding domain-containing protein n=1 Tax=Magnaporthiopsis poae (strain ATCC 64411 / 73-15) TaxID=644358 RepID=A0A0C4EG54_MAGP6|nr:hypothetical protein MAPG_11774 [Magnaporthiopsis poae ATCC 64411]
MATLQLSYEDFIVARSRTNPCVSGLARYVKQPPFASASRLVVVDYPADDNKLPIPQEITALELSKLLACPNSSTAGPRPKRVVLVENIQPQTLIILGQILEVDPVFFAGHVNTNFQNIEKAPLPPSLALFPSQLAEKGFLYVHYQQVIDLGNSSMFDALPYALKTDSSPPRNVRRLPPLSGRQLALARGCCSMLSRKMSDGSWICLVLVDAPVNSVVATVNAGNISKHPSKPLHGGFEDFVQPAPFSSLQDPPHQRSMLGSLVHYFVNHCRLQGLSANAMQPSSVLTMGYYPIRIALAEWVLYTHPASRYVKFYEYTLRNAHNRLHDSDLVDLQRWRRRCKQSQHKLALLAEFVHHWLPRKEQKQRPRDDNNIDKQLQPWDLVLKDIGFLQSQLRDHSRSLEQMIPVATAMVQLLDSRQSITQSADTMRLTYIALVFVPLSWVAGLFSMSERYSPGGNGDFWVYWATALPLLLVVLLLSAFSRMHRPLETLNNLWESALVACWGASWG